MSTYIDERDLHDSHHSKIKRLRHAKAVKVMAHRDFHPSVQAMVEPKNRNSGDL